MSTAALSPFTRIGRQDGQRSVSHGSDQNQRSVIVSVLSARRDRVEQIDEWAARQAREMVSSIEAREVSDDIAQRSMPQEAIYVMQEKSNLRLEDMVEVPKIRTATLVQKWREIEAEADGGLPSRRTSRACSVASNSRSSTNVSNNGSLVGEQPTESEDSDFTDWESAVKTPIAQGVSCGGDNEKGRVADAVRRFTARTPTENSSVPIDEIDSREQTPRSKENGSSPLFDHVMNQGSEVVGNHNSGSLNYRRIRDTRAFKDILIRMEGERLRELAVIGERHVVSQFAHKGRIQSMLRFRSLSREVMVQGQKYPPSSFQLYQLQPGTSVLLLRQKFNTKGKPNTVSNDMLESNNSRTQGEHMENPSFDNLHQNNSRGSKQTVKKGSQQEEIIRKQEIGLEPQVTPPRSSDLAVKDEEANTSAGETGRAKSSCNGLCKCHGQESTRDNIQESDDLQKILEPHSENWQEERPIRAFNAAPQQFCAKPSTSGDLKEEVCKKYEAELCQSNLHDDGNFSSHDSLYNLGDKPMAESNQPKEAMLESQLTSSPVKAYIRAHQHSSSKPSTIGVITEEVISNYEAEQIEKESRILQSNLHSNTDYSSHDPSGNSEDNFPTSYQPEEAIRIHEFESQVASCSAPSSIGEDAVCNQRSLWIDHMYWNDRSSNTPTIQSWDEDMASEEPEMTQLDGYNYGTSLGQPFQEKLRRQATTDWLERVSENVELLELYERRIVSTALASEFRDRLEQIIVNMLAGRGEESIIEANEGHSVCHFCPNNGNLASSKSEQLIVAPLRQFHEKDNHPQNNSVEMDLILELRSDIGRMRQEVSDLKRMITSCMDMQLELHRNAKLNVVGLLLTQLKELCHTNLYHAMDCRRGHMCACFKCAYELQSKSGSCPICRASVIDVVRVHSNS